MKKFALLRQGENEIVNRVLQSVIDERFYDVLDVKNEAVLEDILSDEEYSGFFVTAPYETAAMRLADECSEEVLAYGGADLLLRKDDGILSAYNTEAQGLSYLLKGERPAAKALVIGGGCEAVAARKALLKSGTKKVIILASDEERSFLAERGISDIEGCDNLEAHTDAEVIVGITSDYRQNNIHDKYFEKLELVIDLSLEDYRSEFLQGFERLSSSSRKRIKIKSGLEAMISRAIYSHELWRSGGANQSSKKHTNRKLIAKYKHQYLERYLNIMIIGMPGSGKSSIAKMLAKIRGMGYIDLDRETENLLGESIRDVIADEIRGEPHFRKYETEALRRIYRKSGNVVSAGGGTIVRECNCEMIRANSVVVYIKRPLELLSTKNRPISQVRGVETLYRERASIYERTADIILFNGYTFGNSFDREGNKNSYKYDLKRFAYKLSKSIDKFFYRTYKMDIYNKKDIHNKR